MPKFDVTGIGNANIDIVDQIDQGFLDRFGLSKSHCTYIDESQLKELYAALPQHKVIPGGAVANTINCLNALGLNVAFQGIVANDDVGKVFKADLATHNIADYVHVIDMPNTGTTQIFCLITDDGERTFASYDGIARHLKLDHLNVPAVQDSSLIYFDGYTLYAPHAHAAFEECAKAAHNHKRLVAFNPADVTVAQSFPDACKYLCDISDVLVCNLAEIRNLYGYETLDECARHLPQTKYAGAVTNSANGALVFKNGQSQIISTASAQKPLDTNGAGDHFAAGILYGALNNLPLEQMARLAHLCALDCIAHIGARPQHSLIPYIEQSRKIAA